MSPRQENDMTDLLPQNMLPKEQAAFPIAFNHQAPVAVSHGMSLRDYFAGQALAAILSSDSFLKEAHAANRQPTEYAANVAYKIANAMLAERYQQKGQDDG